MTRRLTSGRRLIAHAGVWLFCLLFLASGCGRGQSHQAVRPVARGQLARVTVILDPGHGGNDSGAIRAGIREDVINYRIASEVASVLRSRGANVIFTVTSSALIPDLKPGRLEPTLQRPADAVLVSTGQLVRLRRDSAPDDLYARAAVARRVWDELPAAVRDSGKGIYFLALHCDNLNSSRGRGARVYFDRRHGVPSQFAVALRDRLTAAHLTNSANGMVIPRHYGVLNPQYNPIPQSALLEMATLSNPSDRAAVRSAPWRWHLAKLIANTIAASEKQGLPQ